MSARLAVSGLRKSFGAAPVLDDVSLSVAPGEVLGIAGPNGAGKTTLFEVLTGFVPADAGTVRLDDRDITGLPPHERARLGLARTFQSPIVPPGVTASQVLEASRRAWKPYLTTADLKWATELVGLDVPGSTVCERLGTLERRRLLLAGLLARRPSVLLLDEPCSGLLEDEIGEVVELARAAVAQLGLALVIIEHRLELLFELADRVIVLHEGAQIANGTAEAVFADPTVRSAYFEGVAA